MERLTKKAKNNKIHSHEPTDYGNDKDRTDLLGEYEDTGLTPKEVGSMTAELNSLQKAYEKLTEKNERLQKECADTCIQLVEVQTGTQGFKSDRDYWKAEALKHRAKLGEIKLLMGRSNG